MLNKGYFKNELVGLFQFSLSSVYFTDKHCLEHIWFGLSNPESEDYTRVQGMMKASISVASASDEQVRLEPQVGPDKTDSMMMAAQLKRTFKQMKFRILEAQDLPTFGTFVKSLECYFKCQFGGGKPFKTNVVSMSDNRVLFDQTFWIPLAEPILNDRLVMQVFDEGTISDTIIGSLVFSVKKMIRTCEDPEYSNGMFLWRDIYGAPPGYDGEAAEEMNHNPEIATFWKGKVLLQIYFEECEKPIKKVEVMVPEVREQAEQKEMFTKDEYCFKAEVGQGIAMPKD